MNLPPINIAMHGVTGRMGTNQHLIRSVLAIMRQGGVELSNGQRQNIEPVLVGRDASKLQHLADDVAVAEIGRPLAWTTDLESVLTDDTIQIFFDSSSTLLRPELLCRAMEQGKAVYCEKPVATDTHAALRVVQTAERTGVKTEPCRTNCGCPESANCERFATRASSAGF